jgi:hypothetical protein
MRLSSLVIVVLAAACCERPASLLICHNSNCAEPQDPTFDDTVKGLESSLALVGRDGRPPIDGVEMDLVLHEGRCLFAHDASVAATSVDLIDAAQIVARHLRMAPVASHDGSRFVFELELKPDRGEPQLDAKVACALAGYAIVRDAARDAGYELDVMFEAYSPALLRAMQARLPVEPGVNARLVLGVGLPQPLLDDNHLLSELDGVSVDVAEVHPGWITETKLESLRTRGYEIDLWFLDATTEMLQSIDQIDPPYVLTGQAQSVRAWLDY